MKASCIKLKVLGLKLKASAYPIRAVGFFAFYVPSRRMIS
jgi:hypothetical protein